MTITKLVPRNSAFLGASFAAQGLAWVEGETRLTNGAALLIR